ncbi:putative protein phosphatase 2c ptc2 protein [Erysiphe necator]|uniref:Protein phosphatase 2C homolog 2 n=1 Tax=Uncinula necator TaxID=52586 RepID=A0A0B1PHP9_UNCNE|nr:putative protein phosphatase 2c ptc2 protein [Erysiphe necator]
MGQNLSEPVTEKSSADGGDERLIYGVASMQGWRFSMEDSHSAILDLRPHSIRAQSITTPIESRLSFFGVYDGHGGDKVAQFAGDNVHLILAETPAFASGNLEQALRDGFLATDRAILYGHSILKNEASGCTATVGLISGTKIFVANAGDSRSVLGVKGRAKPLSFDHKPMNEGEKARIISAGGTVEHGRVNGNLALSRAIGDFDFKKCASLTQEQQAVTVYPDVTIHDISEDDEFMVIACDGIWDCRSSQAVVEFIRRGIAAKQELSKICENLMDNCLSPESEPGGIGCDNMTLIIIGLLHGKSKEEWYEEIARRVSDGDGPCAPPEYAELRGPSVNKNFVDSDNLEEPMLFDISDDDLEFTTQAGKIPISETTDSFQNDDFQRLQGEKSNDSYNDDASDANDTDNLDNADDDRDALPTGGIRKLQNRLPEHKATDINEPKKSEDSPADESQRRLRQKSSDLDVEEIDDVDDHSESRKRASPDDGFQGSQSETSPNSQTDKINETHNLKKSKEQEASTAEGFQRFRNKSPDQSGDHR